MPAGRGSVCAGGRARLCRKGPPRTLAPLALPRGSKGVVLRQRAEAPPAPCACRAASLVGRGGQSPGCCRNMCQVTQTYRMHAWHAPATHLDPRVAAVVAVAPERGLFDPGAARRGGRQDHDPAQERLRLDAVLLQGGMGGSGVWECRSAACVRRGAVVTDWPVCGAGRTWVRCVGGRGTCKQFNAMCM